jgi:uncharacterized membrane protein
MKFRELIKSDWLIWLLILAPYCFIAYYWKAFPERIPIHYNLDGVPNDFAGKIGGLVLLPLINVGLYVLFISLPYIDPRKKNYALFEGKYRMVRLCIHALISFFVLISAMYALEMLKDLSLLLNLTIVIFMMLIGNFLSGVRSNFFIGFRTPWTLSDEKIWIQTHRFVGRLWVGLSALVIPLLLLVREPDLLLPPYFAVLIISPFAYSYYLFRKGKVEK